MLTTERRRHDSSCNKMKQKKAVKISLYITVSDKETIDFSTFHVKILGKFCKSISLLVFWRTKRPAIDSCTFALKMNWATKENSEEIEKVLQRGSLIKTYLLQGVAINLYIVTGSLLTWFRAIYLLGCGFWRWCIV